MNSPMERSKLVTSGISDATKLEEVGPEGYLVIISLPPSPGRGEIIEPTA